MWALNGGHILALTALALPTLVAFTPKGAAPLFIAAAVAMVAAERIAGRPIPRPPSWLGGVLGGFLAWGLASVLWAVDPLEAVGKAGQIAGVFVAGAILLAGADALDETGRRDVSRGLLAGALLCLVVILGRVAVSPDIGLLLDGLIKRTAYARQQAETHFLFLKAVSTVSCVLLWPSVIGARRLWGRRGLWVAATALFAVILLTLSHTALAAAGAGLITFLLARWFFRIMAGLIVGGIFLGLVAAPTLVGYLPPPPSATEKPWSLPLSLVHRVHIWTFATQRIAEKPVLGWGLNASRSLPGGKDEVKLYGQHPDGRIFVNATGEIMPLHPHNAFLQIRLEMGLPGVGLAALLLVLAARRLPRALPGPDERAAALAALVTSMLVGLSSFGVFQSWWMGVLWLTAAFLAAVGGVSTSRPRMAGQSRPPGPTG